MADGEIEQDESTPSTGHAPECANFEDVMQQLKAVVERLERNDVPLEESLSAFEQGVALARLGQQKLDTAERRVEVLLRDGSCEPLDGEAHNRSTT